MADEYFIEPGFIEEGFFEVVSPPPPVALVLFVEVDVLVAFVVADPMLEDSMTERETPAITRKLGSLEPLVVVLRTGDGEPKDLTSYASAEMRARLCDRLGAPTITRALEIVSPLIGGRVEYDPQAADFGTVEEVTTKFIPGDYEIEIELTHNDGPTEIYPQGGRLRLRLEEALA